MKKLICIILSLLICICFVSCSNSNDTQEENTNESVVSEIPTTEKETTTERVTSTTSPAKKDKEKADKLSKAVSVCLSSDGKVDCDNLGGFEYKAENLDTAEMYSMEQSDELAEKAEKNAKAFVDTIKEFYPDKITYEGTDASQFGNSDNGIDSVTYVITYTNTQNQELQIRADSTGEIYYVSCSFTW